MSYELKAPLQNPEEPSRESRYSFHRSLDPMEIEGMTKTGTQEENPTIFQKLEAKYKSSISYYYMIFSALFMCSNAVCVKLLENIPPFELLFFRSILLIIFLAIYITYVDNQITINDRKNRKLIFFQSFLAFFLGYFYFYGIKHMPLSEAIVIMYTNPMFTGFLAWILVKEYYPFYEKLSALISLIGVILMIRPDFIFGESNALDQRKYAALICLAVSLLLSLNGIFIKLTGKTVHPITLVLFGVLFSTILAPIACLIWEGFVWPSWLEVFGIFLMASFNFFGQFFMVKSYQMSEKTIGITLVNYIQMLFAYLFDVIIIGWTPEVYSLVGSVLIILSCLYILVKMRK